MMTREIKTNVLVLTIGASVKSGLATQALRHRWPQMQVSSAGQVLRRMHLAPPEALVLELHRDGIEKACELVGELRRRRPDVPLIVVAGEHGDDLELASRHAGASCYLPHSDDSKPLLDVLSALRSSSSASTTLYSGLAPPGPAPPGPAPPFD